jgi:hypothetical protein
MVPSSVVLKPDPCYVDKLIADEWFSFPYSGAKTRYLFYGISRNLYLFSFLVSAGGLALSPSKKLKARGIRPLRFIPSLMP